MATNKGVQPKRAEIRRRLKSSTPREVDVLCYVLGGQLNREIAAELGITERRIKVHRGNVMEKLGVQSTAQLFGGCSVRPGAPGILSEQRKRLGFYKTRRLKLPPNAAPVNLDALIAKTDAQIQKLGRATITEYELITVGKTEEDYAAYLRMSDAAHTSPADMESILKFDKKGNFLGYIYGPHDRDLATFAVYADNLQSHNLVNTNKVIKGALPASFTAFQNRRIQLRSDMPGIFNPQMSVQAEEITVAAQPKSSAKKEPKRVIAE